MVLPTVMFPVPLMPPLKMMPPVKGTKEAFPVRVVGPLIKRLLTVALATVSANAPMVRLGTVVSCAMSNVEAAVTLSGPRLCVSQPVESTELGMTVATLAVSGPL